MRKTRPFPSRARLIFALLVLIHSHYTIWEPGTGYSGSGECSQGHSRAWVQLVVVRSMHHIQGSSPHKSWAKSLVGRYVSVLFFKSSRILWNLVRSPLSPTRFLNYLGTWMLYRPGNRSKYFNLKSYSDVRVSTRGHVQHDKPVDGRCKCMIAVFEML